MTSTSLSPGAGRAPVRPAPGPTTARASEGEAGARAGNLPPDALEKALALVGCVHDCGPAEVAAAIDDIRQHNLAAVLVALAALVPADKTARELLAWNDCRYPVENGVNTCGVCGRTVSGRGRPGCKGGLCEERQQLYYRSRYLAGRAHPERPIRGTLANTTALHLVAS